MLKKKAVVLLSSGLDSAYNLAEAVQQFEVLLALTFNYGQRAATKEVQHSQQLANHFKVPHRVIELPWFKEFQSSALLNKDIPVPKADDLKIEDQSQSEKSAKVVWVPNRNGIFLNIAAAFAENLGAQFLVPGFNKEEAQTFPDNSEAFLKSLDQSFSFSTANKVQTHCFSTNMNKSQILAAAKKLELPFQSLWPCYEAMDQWCGECESCLRFKRALSENDISFEEYNR